MPRIFVQSTIKDARANIKHKQFSSLGLKNKLGAVRQIDCYAIDAKLNHKQIEKAKNLLANPLTQTASTLLPSGHFSFALEIGFLPGVTDNLGNTAKETLADGAKIKFKPGQNVYSSQVFFISGSLTKTDAQKIANSLYNPLIQSASLKTFEELKKLRLINSSIPKVKLLASNKVLLVNLDVADDELMRLGKLGIKSGNVYRGPLALGLSELKAIRNYFAKLGRKPSDVELETLAQTWSEHCKHTIFADPIDELKDGIFKSYIKKATDVVRKQKAGKDFCVSVFTDNAGGIKFDANNIVSYKVETHNTPSALDPFGGSITGIVGVNRDILGFGLGAKPIGNFYGFCLGDPGDQTKLFRDKELKQPMLSAKRIMDGVIAGINAGGNQSGIPTPLGFLYFDPRFRGKPLVFAGTLGLTPKKVGQKNGWQKKAKPGDLIIMVGGRVGADGIHGATFSSEGLDSKSPATAVQIGDPITQKKLSDAIIKEARDQQLYSSITDCGAGGLSSAVGEMAKDSGGCEVWLDKVPLKYPGLQPWQIWISESQERMILSVPKNKWQKFQKLMQARGVEATAIGQFTNAKKCLVSYKKQIVMNIDMEFLHNGRPQHNQQTKSFKPKTSRLTLPNKKDYSDQILSLLSRLNITSTEFVSRQYDHEVQGSSLLKPLQGAGAVTAEASAIRPVLTSQKGLVLSYGLHPQLSDIHPYNMAACAIDSAIRAAVAAGADVDYLGLLDNFCWSSPQDSKRLWQLKQAAQACFDYGVAFGTPFISGKDSMYNDFKGFDNNARALKISVPPTLLITAVGVIPDITKTISIDAKCPGDLLYILGETNNELAGSEYLELLNKPGGKTPNVDAQNNYRLYKNLFKAAQNNLVSSAISLNRGGLAVALCKSLVAGNLGAELSLNKLPGSWDQNYQALFSESQGRILVTVDEKKALEFESVMKDAAFGKLGKITGSGKILIIDRKDKKIANFLLTKAAQSYKATFKNW